METIIYNLFIHNWQRKLVALVAALVLWLFVNHTINETKTITSVPVRVTNLPSDKTISGLLPNGILSKRITLTLTGTKDIIDELEAGDLEVSIDASSANQDDWVVQITKKNLVSLNPAIDLPHHITNVAHSDFIIKLSKLVTAKIPVIIGTPTGVPPQGYEFLDIWPQHLKQTVSGPEGEIQILKEKGLELTFDLKEVTKSELDAIKNSSANQNNDEISFPIPKKWKQISIPFQHNKVEELNDPEAQNLHMDFLRKEFIPLDAEIPIRVFYPLNESDTINPETYSLAPNADIKKKNGIDYLSIPLFASDVSRLFIEVVRHYIEIVVVASPKSEREKLGWSLEFINPHDLEDMYVAFSLANFERTSTNSSPKKREEMLRKRFREYMQRVTLHVNPEQKLRLKSFLEDHQIRVNIY